MNNDKITSINLSSCVFPENSTEKILNMLDVNQRIRKIDVYKTNISDEDMKAINAKLDHNVSYFFFFFFI